MKTSNHITVFSKNRLVPDAPHTVSCTLSNPLTCAESEFFTVKLQAFNSIKSFYGIQKGFNDTFAIVLEEITGDDVDTFTQVIPEGNYDIKTLLTIIKQLCFGLLEIEYDRRLNKFIYTRLALTSGDNTQANIEDYDIFIEPMSAGSVLGIKEKKLIDYTDTLSDTFINIISFSTFLVKLGGLSLTNTQTNMSNQRYEVSKIIASIDVASVAPMDSIIYLSNDQECDEYRVSEKVIQEFSIQVVTDGNKTLPDMADFIASIVITKNTVDLPITYMYNEMMGQIQEILYFIASFFNRLQ